jgi:hypothetical protein
MVKARKSSKARLVPLHKVRVRSSFKFEGVTYMKYAPKKGITPEGKTVSLTDATMVEPC